MTIIHGMSTTNWPVVWITGFAGAGKTTHAKLLIERLGQRFQNVVHLDGDIMREVCGSDLGFSTEDRLKNAFRLARMSNALNSQGLIVVVSTISMYPEIWVWNRENFGAYLEILLKVDEAELSRRNKKNLYSPESKEVVGRDLLVAEPAKPHLELESNSDADLEPNIERILAALKPFLGL